MRLGNLYTLHYHNYVHFNPINFVPLIGEGRYFMVREANLFSVESGTYVANQPRSDIGSTIQKINLQELTCQYPTHILGPVLNRKSRLGANFYQISFKISLLCDKMLWHLQNHSISYLTDSQHQTISFIWFWVICGTVVLQCWIPVIPQSGQNYGNIILFLPCNSK